MNNDCQLIDIHLRWTNGEDLLLTVTSQDSISVIKQLIRKSAVEHTSKKTMRLIHRGQLLKDDSLALSDYNITDSSIFIHCALSDPIIPTNTIVSADEEDEKPKQCIAAGFDKLRESGYNDEEIRSIRTQFHEAHASPNYVDGEPPSEEEIELEEQWMAHSGSMLPEEQNSFKEMLCGLLLGFFLGVLCLFWVKESVFTRRHQLGIMAGMLINVSCGVIVYT